MAYRSYEKRKSVYLNIEEAKLVKEALFPILEKEVSKRDMICELVVEMNECIKECQEYEARRGE